MHYLSGKWYCILVNSNSIQNTQINIHFYVLFNLFQLCAFYIYNLILLEVFFNQYSSFNMNKDIEVSKESKQENEAANADG